MTETTPLHLTIHEHELGKFCNKLIQRSRDITKTHDALITLETFISVFGREAHGTDAFNHIDQMIKNYTEQTRIQLMEQESRKLYQALKSKQAAAIAHIHTPMSRNGFYQILQTASSKLTADELTIITSWAIDWVTQAKRKAEQASGYPEAYDFKKAGISIEEFQAMDDVGRYLGSLNS